MKELTPTKLPQYIDDIHTAMREALERGDRVFIEECKILYGTHFPPSSDGGVVAVKYTIYIDCKQSKENNTP